MNPRFIQVFTTLLGLAILSGCGEDLRPKVAELEDLIQKEKAASAAIKAEFNASAAVAKAQLDQEIARTTQLSAEIASSRATIADLTARLALAENLQAEVDRKRNELAIKNQWNAVIGAIRSQCEGIKPFTRIQSNTNFHKDREDREKELEIRKRNCKQLIFDLQSKGIPNTKKLEDAVDKLFDTLKNAVFWAWSSSNSYSTGDTVGGFKAAGRSNEYFETYEWDIVSFKSLEP
jgi:hypothetical protein